MNKLITALWVLIGALSRVLPHFPDATAMTALSTLSAGYFSRARALAIVLSALLLSDLYLGYRFGSWTLFTYSGFVAITLLPTGRYPWLNTLLASLGFWLWTNFGTWLCSGMYAHSLTGLTSCYIAALPFLRNAVIGSQVWLYVLTLSSKGAKAYCRAVAS